MFTSCREFTYSFVDNVSLVGVKPIESQGLVSRQILARAHQKVTVCCHAITRRLEQVLKDRSTAWGLLRLSLSPGEEEEEEEKLPDKHKHPFPEGLWKG